MNKKIIKLTIIFLLLIPFGLPIGVLFINIITNIVQIGNTVLTPELLVANVVLTKVLYNLILSVFFCIKIYKITSQFIKNEISESILIIIAGLLLFIYNIFDGINTYELFYVIYNN